MARELASASGTQSPLNLSEQAKIFLHAVLFVSGFSAIFIIGWGGAATLLGQVFSDYKTALSRLGGVVVLIFGLHTLGIFKLRFLNYELRFQRAVDDRASWLSSLLMGVFFAAGWTPCIGTTLGAIMTLSFSPESANQALVLAGSYALGMGIPFLILGSMVARARSIVIRFRPYIRYIAWISGLLQIAIGIMLLTNSLYLIAIWAQRNGFFIDAPLGGIQPSYPVAMLAGLLSFLSPCVLPLVPAYLGYLSGYVVE
jgi:cytochrome c-type biogenesis protein